MLLNQLGLPNVGHGVISEIGYDVLKAQLSKKKFDEIEYNRKILEEFQKEQSIFYRIVRGVAEGYAKEWAEVHEVEGTYSYLECIEYWIERMTALLALQYKLISVGVESQWLNDNLDFGDKL